MEARSHWICLHGSGYFMEVGAYGHLFHGSVPSMEVRCHWARLLYGDGCLWTPFSWKCPIHGGNVPHWACLHGSDSFMEKGTYGHLFHGSVPSVEARCHWACLQVSDSFMEMGAYGHLFHRSVPSMEARCHWACFYGSDSFMEVVAECSLVV
ncbi:hypothetical protein MRB53_006374 [Persea americana]|uniref:Uncharacterized protein n=2 Tax=Persea americana TaxID=3435 RepID=A0ACC2MH02_PERAE|nr:hypothetical protein MRB53_006372 [Persea americana]KAJ8644626.1 hypothetical protein MRB53_006374 [Persea americana]